MAKFKICSNFYWKTTKRLTKIHLTDYCHSMESEVFAMKRTLLIIVFLICALRGLSAQTISNLRSELDPAGYYRISYDLSGREGDLYLIRITPYAGSREVTNPKNASGAGITSPVAAGKDLQIFWNPVLEGVGSANWQFRLSVISIPHGMVLVEGGSFLMSSNDGEGDEKPVHQVTVSAFLIGKYEVTQKEWTEIMGNNPSNFRGDELPVEQVTWYNVVEYCNKRSLKEGLTPCYSGSGSGIVCNWTANGYRLPTEAEWEFAARGGKQTRGYTYSGSNDLGSVAWYNGNSGITTHAVGTKAANELGIHDMSGNVWEWCWDWYASYSSGSQNNPAGASSGSNRVLRGGGWNYYGYGNCRVSGRGSIIPGNSINVGVRVSRAIF